MELMSFEESSERLATHGKRLWTEIGKAGKYDKGLEEDLSKEWDGVLRALLDILDDMGKRLEHRPSP